MRARSVATTTASVTPSSWASDAPASWKRVPSIVATRTLGCSAAEGAGLVRQRVQVGVEPASLAVVGPVAERVGAERTARRRTGSTPCSLPEAPATLEPLRATGGRRRGRPGRCRRARRRARVERPLVDGVVAAEPQPHRRRAAFELGHGGDRALADVDDLPDVPTGAGACRGAAADERLEAGQSGVGDRVGSGVQRLDRDAVVGRRAQRARRRRRAPANRRGRPAGTPRPTPRRRRRQPREQPTRTACPLEAGRSAGADDGGDLAVGDLDVDPVGSEVAAWPAGPRRRGARRAGSIRTPRRRRWPRLR